MRKLISLCRILAFAVILFLLVACQGQTDTSASGDRLQVIATTSIVGDIVQQIGGERIDLTVLLPTGTDPHGFQPSPRDLVSIQKADLIFANGAGLEEFLKPLIENSDTKAPVIYVSDGVELQKPDAQSELVPSEHTAGDPHTWFDPENVKIWVKNIEQALIEADPGGKSDYSNNAQVYTGKLDELDRWIQTQVAELPLDQRLLVTDHTSFTYFAKRYGFQQVGALIPAYSTLAESSAQQLASLEDAIQGLKLKAVFVSESTNPALAERVAQDTGIRLVRLYNGSLSQPDGPAATYLDFMRYNVRAIVDALK
jgi:ABC-type Zn uptake system ZnuABC Zn-binding protein ZnuA